MICMYIKGDSVIRFLKGIQIQALQGGRETVQLSMMHQLQPQDVDTRGWWTTVYTD